MASITVKTEVLVTLDVPDNLAPEMSKQDVCDTIADAIGGLSGTALVMVRESSRGHCAWSLVPNFGDIPATEADVYSADDAFANVED